VLRIGDLVVGIAVEIIAQETDALFEGDQLAAEGEVIDFSRVEKSPGHREVALSEGLEHAHLQTDPGQVGLVLGRGAGGAAHHIPEIVEGDARHDGVEIDDTDARAGIEIEHDIVQLGVIMGDTQRHLTLSQGIEQLASLVLTLEHEGQLFGDRADSSGNILLDGDFQIIQSFWGVVEIGDGFMQFMSWKIRQTQLELAEGFGRADEGLNAVGLLQTGRIFDEKIGPPKVVVPVLQPVFTRAGLDQSQRLAVRIATVLRDDLAQVRSDLGDVFHQGLGIFENERVDPLQDVALDPAVRQNESDLISVIDMTLAMRLDIEIVPFKLKLPDRLFQLGRCRIHFIAPRQNECWTRAALDRDPLPSCPGRPSSQFPCLLDR